MIPILSISTVTTSPSLRNTGGSRKTPTPAGVPVEMTSPGNSVIEEETNEMIDGDVEGHVRRRALLHHDFAQPLADRERARIAELVGGHDPGAARGEGVEALSPEPLPVAVLDRAGAHVVERHVPGDVERASASGIVARLASDHDGELGLGVDVLDPGTDDDDRQRAGERTRGLRKEERDRRRLLLLLEGVIAVVQAEADDLAGALDGRVEARFLEGEKM